MHENISLYSKNFEYVSNPIFVLNRNFQIIFANQIMRLLFNTFSLEYQDEYVEEIISGSDDFHEFCENKVVSDQQLYFTDCSIKNNDVNYFLYITPYLDIQDNFLFYHCSLHSIYEQNVDTEEQNIYWDTFERLNIAVVHASNASVLDVNQAFTRLTGLEKKDVVGKFSLNLAMQLCDQDTLKTAKKIIRQYLMGRKLDKEIIFFNNKYLRVSTLDNFKTIIMEDVTEETKNLRKLEELHRIADKLAQDLPVEKYFEIVIEASQYILDFSSATIFKAESNRLILANSTISDYQKGLKIDINDGIYGKTFRKQKSYIIDNIATNKQTKLFSQDYQSILSVPIGEFGIFLAHSIETKAFTKNDQQMAELLIEHLKQALIRTKANEEIARKERKYQAVFENAAVATALFNKSGKIKIVNDKFTRKFALSTNITNISIYDFFHGKEKAKIKSLVKNIIKGKIKISSVIETQITCSNKLCDVICYAKLLPGDEEMLLSFADITKLKTVEKELKANIYEKNILLKEIHHRVKNNLQIIASYIRFYLNSLDKFDKEAIYREINAKINTISIVHERLYQSDSYQNISINKYIKKLMPGLLSTYQQRKITVTYDLEDLYIDLNKSIPLGLILSEVITNSIKYAFPDTYSAQPEIHVSLHKIGNSYEFIISDNGIGMDLDKKAFGHELIAILTKQLNGYMKFDNNQGVTFSLKIPVAA